MTDYMKISFRISQRLVVPVVIGAALILPARLFGQIFICATPTEPELVAVKNAVVSIVTGSDTGARSRYHLPATTASKVAIVPTPKTCQAAGQAFKTAYPTDVTPGNTYRMFLLKVSSNRYVLVNADFHPGGRTLIMTFDTKWHLLGEVVN